MEKECRSVGSSERMRGAVVNKEKQAELQAVFETTVQKVLRRFSDADAKAEEFMAEFRSTIKQIIELSLEIQQLRGMAPEVAMHFAEKHIYELAGIRMSRRTSRHMQVFAKHQQEWIANNIKRCIEEIKMERRIA